jgi:hypothetical protein
MRTKILIVIGSALVGVGVVVSGRLGVSDTIGSILRMLLLAGSLIVGGRALVRRDFPIFLTFAGMFISLIDLSQEIVVRSGFTLYLAGAIWTVHKAKADQKT